MTRKDIIRVISEELGLTQLQTRQIVYDLFDAIVNTLAKDGRVELRNFGVFEVRWRKARKARNPRTGEKVMVPKHAPSSSSQERRWGTGRIGKPNGGCQSQDPVQGRILTWCRHSTL